MPHHTTRHSSEVKTCTKCGEVKPLNAFSRHRRSKDGFQGRCKACFSAWHAANRERELERMRVWREANREHHAELCRAWKEANPEKRAEYAARERVRYPDRTAARLAVYRAIQRGELTSPRDLPCTVCGAPAEQYHHHKGYAPENHFDVTAVCIPCHTAIHRTN